MSTIKRRIQMMNRQRTPRILAICFALIVPVAIVLLLVFRKQGSMEANPAAFAYDLDSTRLAKLKSDRRDLIISGLILDARTGKPVPGFALQVARFEKPFKKIWTDMSGFYYLAVPADSSDYLEKADKYFIRNGSRVYPEEYTVASVSTMHKGFIFGENRLADIEGYGSYMVIFAARNDEYNAPTSLRWINKSELYPSAENVSRLDLFSDLQIASLKFKDEQHLLVAFKDRFPRPTSVVTKFRNAYFDRDRRLMGYENEIEFFLDGQNADYTEVNEAFARSPYMLKSSQEYIVRAEKGEKEKRFYLTFDLHKPAPPAALLAGNVEVQNIDSFDPSILQKQAYLLDGFRQTFGVGSNMMPEKKEIVKVLRFKGRLARYYDRKLDEIWWIETRPAAEVFERPDFAALR